jgi:hypothetical protein
MAGEPTRSVPARVLVTALALLAASLLLARLLTGFINGRADGPNFATESTKRLHSIIAALPSIVETPHAVVFLGSSPMEVGISPEVFDERIHASHPGLVSFNLGFAGVTPILLRTVTRRVQRAFASANRKAHVAILELNPVQATERASESERLEALVLLNMLEVLEPRDWPSFLRRSPVLAGRVATYLALGGYPPAHTTRVLGGLIFGGGGGWWAAPETTPMDDSVKARIEKLGATIDDALARIYGGPMPAWDPKHRGEVRTVFPETIGAKRELASLTSAEREQRTAFDREIQVDLDIIDLEFDPRQIEDLLVAVREARQFSEHTFVVIPPRNPDWIEHSAEGKARLRAVIERIERDGEVRVIDFDTTPVLDGKVFADTTHLDEMTGRERYSKLLAERVSELLRAEER